MATEVYTTEEIILLDDTEVELRPLPVAKLRKFSRLWSEHMKDIAKRLKEAEKAEEEDGEIFSDADLTDAQFDVFIKMCALGLERQLKDTMTDKQFREYLEDVLDEKTIYKILEVTGNLQFGGTNDPNLKPPTAPGVGTA